MLYILDANVLIDANRDYYPRDRVPEFWEWLVEMGAQGLVKIPIEVYEEIKDGTDDLAAWAKQSDVRDALLLSENCDESLVATAVDEGYAPDLTDDDVEKIGRDPFLVAYGRIEPSERCIVTTEVSKPSQQRANRHLPDVCDHFAVHHCNTYQFIRKLDFKTAWKAPALTPEETVG
jgi:hypothetical protein